MLNVFETTRKNASVHVAKDRLKSLIVSDRVDCTPDTFEKIHTDLYKTISKYIEVVPEEFDVRMTKNYIYIKLAGEEL